MAAIKSVEEKALAYDKAIEALRSLIAEQAIKHCDRVNIKDITNIFSELKESEDERIRKELIEFVKSRGGFKQEYITWLEKQGEQKPVWSEEDEKMLANIICSVNACDALDGTISISLEKHEKKISWLKSLRPNYWKPSEEQLNALHWCVMNVGSTEHQVLQELLEQLEKLKD